ncbi:MULTISPECIES: TIGR04211 family SH3 domain-containing protein [Methylocaldum]|uniref:TIGR04211 family SH3 domain-containing protein n=1 Tax=unclassified Methylocaldum TaxID=2622260 RepID=UPI00105C5937|nr:TIGR04211 family SH3 domain-containing protein [Methylocaldum sp. 14B]MBP1149642.1 SH3 domain protein [Methylocaldum sp. RMAD-M]MDV3241486.1 TIGR04211 family SH3 domain-containing protein [Methylocaldum sp.]MVF20853.1 TIGR04211 family SH3 domain-containing protein [Methylocaldum sp. BRCS4]
MALLMQKNTLTTILFVLILSAPVTIYAAEKAYVTDRLEVQLRRGQSLQHKIVRMVPSGTAVNVLEKNPQTGYSFVRLDSGEEGWILSRYLSDQPIAINQLDEMTKKLETALEENKRLKSELSTVTSGKQSTDKTAQQLQAETTRLNTELMAIRQASANVLQIQAERDMLRESVIKLERELDTIRREKQALDEDHRQDWFMIGAGVLFGGIVLGVVLPRMSWRKKSAWGSF